jgi:hypothetical protein
VFINIITEKGEKENGINICRKRTLAESIYRTVSAQLGILRQMFWNTKIYYTHNIMEVNYMKITDITLTTKQVCDAGEGTALAVGVASGYEQADGKRINNLTHIKVETIMNKNRYEKVTVKVVEAKNALAKEQIAQQESLIKIEFKTLLVNFIVPIAVSMLRHAVLMVWR